MSSSSSSPSSVSSWCLSGASSPRFTSKSYLVYLTLSLNSYSISSGYLTIRVHQKQQLQQHFSLQYLSLRHHVIIANNTTHIVSFSLKVSSLLIGIIVTGYTGSSSSSSVVVVSYSSSVTLYDRIPTWAQKCGVFDVDPSEVNLM